MTELVRIFRSKCAYCEQALGNDSEWDLDLHRPRETARQLDGSIDDLHYWWLGWEWTNMYLACKTCVLNKGTLFPTRARRVPAESPVGHLSNEMPLLLDPCLDNPSRHLVFTDVGAISDADDERGRVSIDTFQLNRGDLNLARRRRAQELREQFDRHGETGFDQEELAARPFSGMARQLLNRWIGRGTTDISALRPMSPASRSVGSPATSSSPSADDREPISAEWRGTLLNNRWRIQAARGRGGFGTVYSATDGNMADRTVAVKIGHETHEKFRRRWRKEVDHLLSLEKHPHVVQVLDQGVVRDQPFIVLQFLDGGTLADKLRNGRRQSPDEVLHWLKPIASALDFLHAEAAVIHRDVKPANIMFDAPDDVPFLVDFGITRELVPSDSTITESGGIPVSPKYMPPDPWMNHPLTGAYDQYSLAIVVYEALAGRAPFPEGSVQEVVAVKTREEAPSILTVADDLPAGIDAALRRSLLRDPAARFPTCSELAEAVAEGSV